MNSHKEYQEALQEVKTLLDDMTKNEDAAFKYHYYIRLKSIELLQNLVDLYPEYIKHIQIKEK